MKDHLDARQAADELRTLNATEIEAVSGGEIKIDMGYFGQWTIGDGCVTATMDIGDFGWMTIGQC